MKRIVLLLACAAVMMGCVREKFTTLQGTTVMFDVELQRPDMEETKLGFIDDEFATGTTLKWNGDESIRLIFGNSGADNKDNPLLYSTAPGVFKGEVTIPQNFSLDSLQGIIAPGTNDCYYRKNRRVSMYVPEIQTQAKNGEPNWDYLPFFYDMTDGGTLEQRPDGSYGFTAPLKLKPAASLLAFNVYGSHAEQEAGEVLRSIRIKAIKYGEITKANISGRTEDLIGSTENSVSNYGHSFLRVNLEEEVTIADKTKDNGVKVFAGIVLGGKRCFSEVRVETNKAVYTKTFETPKSLSKTYYSKFVVNRVALDLSTFTKRLAKSSKEYKINEIVRISGIPSLQVTYTKGDDIWESYIAVNDEFYCKYDVSAESQPLTTETIYQAASISKPPLAYIALKMREEGKIDFEKPLYKYWGVYDDTDDISDETEDAANELLALFIDDASKEKAKKITALMVMHHKTGLDNSTYKDINYKATPGAKYNYSGPAIHLLDLTLGKILGKTLTEYGKEYIFDKIGMTKSSYTYLSEYDKIGAKGYRSDGSEWQRGNLKGPNAAYSMRTTADEYSKFLRWVLDGCDLNEESARMYLDKYFNMGKDWEEWHNLIYRTEVNEELGDVVFHTGSNGFSFRGWSGFFPDHDATLCMFANSTSPNGYDHFSAVLALFMGNTKPLSPRASNKHIPDFE